MVTRRITFDGVRTTREQRNEPRRMSQDRKSMYKHGYTLASCVRHKSYVGITYHGTHPNGEASVFYFSYRGQ